jgi:Txe/YoeB family toxin of Txe-Axe toxin-antitoxin module
MRNSTARGHHMVYLVAAEQIDFLQARYHYE